MCLRYRDSSNPIARFSDPLPARLATAHAASAFSLLELLVTIAIVAILATMLIGGMGALRSRAQRLQCVQNLKSLYAGAELYIQQNSQWPQIVPSGSGQQAERELAGRWIAALQPFGVPPKAWICPTIQQLMRNPDLSRPENTRIDYFPCAFDDKPGTPHQWPTQPWFIERGDLHGNGNLMIFTDGRVVAAREIVPR